PKSARAKPGSHPKRNWNRRSRDRPRSGDNSKRSHIKGGMMATYEPFVPSREARSEGNGKQQAPVAEGESVERDRVPANARTMTMLFRQLSDESLAFLQAEMALVRVEANEAIKRASMGAVALAAGSIIAGLGLWSLVATMIW